MRVLVPKSVDKFLSKQAKGDPKGIEKVRILLRQLEIILEPTKMPNAKKMKNYKHLENCWRWRMGNYRVVGDINDIECIIKIIEISTREDAYGM